MNGVLQKVNTGNRNLFQKVNIYIDYNNTDRVLDRDNNNTREVFRWKMLLFTKSLKR